MPGYEDIEDVVNDRYHCVAGTHGIFSEIAKRAHVTIAEVTDWYSSDERFARLVDYEKQALIDAAETNLANAIASGDMKATYFMLSTLGKNRGFTDKETTGQADINYNTTYQVLDDNPREVRDGKVIQMPKQA